MTRDPKFSRVLMALNDFVSGRLRSSPLLVRLLFGVRVQQGLRKSHWDYTTLILRKALSELLRPGLRILEIGVGDHALLSIFAARRRPLSVTGVDVVAEVVANARHTAVVNAASIEIFESDMFSRCAGVYDLVFWNIPYVPRRAQARRRAETYADVVWDGGPDGTELIRRCLREAPPYLTGRGRLVLGVNTFYVSAEKFARLVQTSGFRIERVIRAWPNPSQAFILVLEAPR
jgi:HemK-related putative methylase